jgi:hypothetical protein
VAAAHVQIALAVKGGSVRPSAISTPGSSPQSGNIPHTAAVFAAYPVEPVVAWHRHGHDIINRRKAMNREHEHDDLIDLGPASIETKGGPRGKDDHFAGLVQIEGLSDE